VQQPKEDRADAEDGRPVLPQDVQAHPARGPVDVRVEGHRLEAPHPGRLVRVRRLDGDQEAEPATTLIDP
jgi:hypothetical protein